jgi:hypothetical protein
MFNSMALKRHTYKFYGIRQGRTWGLKAHDEYVQLIRKQGGP